VRLGLGVQGTVAQMTVTGATRRQEEKSPFSPLPSGLLACTFADPNKKPAGEGELWFAEFQPRYHRADYIILDNKDHNMHA